MNCNVQIANITMDGDEMKRGSNFFRRNQYQIAALCLVAAVLGLTGVYMYAGRETTEEQSPQVAVEETQESLPKQEVAVEEPEESVQEEPKEQEKKKSVVASTVIMPQRQDEIRDVKTDVAQADAAKPEDEGQETVETINTSQAAPTELHFDTEAGLMWPLNGAVILDYSMDRSVYFATLDQYKYNPAVIISGNVNEKVKAAASGKITGISTNEETGCTVTMDIGDGYTATYGQLKEVPYEPGAYLEAGNTIGFVSEPTKYYSQEGSNLYFQLQKDGSPIDPVDFFAESEPVTE